MEDSGDERSAEESLGQDKNSRHSKFRERMIEHSFLAELLQECWVHRGKIVEVSRSEIDIGYDLILEVPGVIRHVQLKSTVSGGQRRHQDLQESLGRKPSGCAVWIEFKEDDVSGRLKLDYRFFGEAPGRRMKDLSHYEFAKQSRGNAKGVKAPRKALRRVPKKDFAPVKDIQELWGCLFGAAPSKRR